MVLTLLTGINPSNVSEGGSSDQELRVDATLSIPSLTKRLQSEINAGENLRFYCRT